MVTVIFSDDQVEALRRLLDKPRERWTSATVGDRPGWLTEAPEWAADERALSDVRDLLDRAPRTRAA